MPWLMYILSNLILASLLALAACFVQRRLHRPALAHVLWILVLVKLVTPPLVSVPFAGSPGLIACSMGVCGCEQHPRAQSIVRDTLPWILLTAWSVGAGVAGCIAYRRWSRLKCLLGHACPAPPEWQMLAGRLGADISIRRQPEILAVPGRLPPLVVPGLARPRLLLPIALLDRLSAAQRSALLLHELIHIKRGDHLVRLLEMAVGVAFWWLPIISPVGRQLRACEEMCCDASVVDHLSGERREYARLLLNVLDFVNPLPEDVVPQATAMSAAHDLEQRMRAILGGTQRPRRAWPATVFVLAVAIAILPLGLRYQMHGGGMPNGPAARHSPEQGTTILPDEHRDGDGRALGCCPS